MSSYFTFKVIRPLSITNTPMIENNIETLVNSISKPDNAYPIGVAKSERLVTKLKILPNNCGSISV